MPVREHPTDNCGYKERQSHLPRCCASLVRPSFVEALEAVWLQGLRIGGRISSEDLQGKTLRDMKKSKEARVAH